MTSRRKRDTEDRKALILDAAEQIMREEGYAAVTSRRVAQRTGSNTTPIHYYFKSMDELFLTLYRRSEERYCQRLVKALSSATPLRDLWALGRDPIDAGLVNEYLALANHRPRVREEVARSGERVRIVETAIVASSLKNVEFLPDRLPPTVLSFIFEAVCRTLVSDRGLGITAAHEEVESFVERLLDSAEPSEDTIAPARRARARAPTGTPRSRAKTALDS